MACEGGFQGRTNKLVDGCYSFWQASLLPIVQSYLVETGQLKPLSSPLFDRGKQKRLMRCLYAQPIYDVC
jgi:protein farnesyltransferase subunit beta